MEFFFTQTFTEPHSTKQIEDAIGWGRQTDPQAILRGMDAEWTNDRGNVLWLGTQVPCPTLVIQDRRTRSWDLRAGLPWQTQSRIRS